MGNCATNGKKWTELEQAAENVSSQFWCDSDGDEIFGDENKIFENDTNEFGTIDCLKNISL